MGSVSATFTATNVPSGAAVTTTVTCSNVAFDADTDVSKTGNTVTVDISGLDADDTVTFTVTCGTKTESKIYTVS